MVIKIEGDTNNTDLEEIPEIKKYFSRIYTVLSKDIRDKLKQLKVSKEKMELPAQVDLTVPREYLARWGRPAFPVWSRGV